MILSKQYLNQKVSSNLINENFKFQKTIVDSREYDIFISYSWNDKEYAYKIVYLLENCGYKVYVDYKDLKLDRHKVSEKTARQLTLIMKKCKGLLYLHSPSASASKWCPWEVGYFSGIKDFHCANLPLIEKENDEFKNQEYLEIYPYIEYAKDSETQKFDFWVCDNNDKTNYTKLKRWINGSKLVIKD